MIFNIQNNHLIFEIEFLMTPIIYENISINTENNWQFYTTLSLAKNRPLSERKSVSVLYGLRNLKKQAVVSFYGRLTVWFIYLVTIVINTKFNLNTL